MIGQVNFGLSSDSKIFTISQYSRVFGSITINKSIRLNNESLPTWQNNSFSQPIFSLGNFSESSFDHLWANPKPVNVPSSPRGTITTQVYREIPPTYNNPNMQQLCHSVTTNPILASLYRMLQRCPQRTTLSIFTESVWTEIVKYIHSPDLGRQIHKMGIWSLSQNGRLVKPISGMIYCSRGHFYLLIHTSSNRANRLTIVYFKGYAYNAYPLNDRYRHPRIGGMAALKQGPLKFSGTLQYIFPSKGYREMRHP